MSSKVIIGILVLIIIIGIFYFYNKNKSTQKIADIAVSNISPPCIPFTKAQQDAEKRQKLADCTNKLLIPIVGEVQYAACVSNVKTNLTPIVNC